MISLNSHPSLSARQMLILQEKSYVLIPRMLEDLSLLQVVLQVAKLGNLQFWI